MHTTLASYLAAQSDPYKLRYTSGIWVARDADTKTKQEEKIYQVNVAPNLQAQNDLAFAVFPANKEMREKFLCNLTAPGVITRRLFGLDKYLLARDFSPSAVEKYKSMTAEIEKHYIEQDTMDMLYFLYRAGTFRPEMADLPQYTRFDKNGGVWLVNTAMLADLTNHDYDAA